MTDFKQWQPVPFCVECVDVWHPGTLTQVCRDAYDRLARAGRIKPIGVQANQATGRVTVRYMADCPQQWIREELRQAKLEGVQIKLGLEG